MHDNRQAQRVCDTLAEALQAAIEAALPPAPTANGTPPAAPVPPRTIYTVGELSAAEPALTIGGIRADLFNRRTNGLAESGAVIRRGRLLLLHRDRYMEWLIKRGQEL